MKKLSCLLLSILLTVFLALPAMAQDVPYGGDLYFITDEPGLLTDDQWEALEERAEAISMDYDCGVYVIAVYDYQEFGSTVERACDRIRKDYALGCGEDQNAIILLLSMEERDYTLRTYGDMTADGITEYGMDLLVDSFLDYLGDDDWYRAFSGYLDQSELLLEAAQEGEPMDKPLSARLAGSYGVALVIGTVMALIVCTVLKSRMKTAVKATSASAYVAPSGVQLQVRDDVYTHTTRTQRKIEKSGSSGGGGGATHSRSGKF